MHSSELFFKINSKFQILKCTSERAFTTPFTNNQFEKARTFYLDNQSKQSVILVIHQDLCYPQQIHHLTTCFGDPSPRYIEAVTAYIHRCYAQQAFVSGNHVNTNRNTPKSCNCSGTFRMGPHSRRTGNFIVEMISIMENVTNVCIHQIEPK